MICALRRWALVSSFVLVASSVVAQEENGNYKPPSSEPDKLFFHNDWVYFSADDGQYGRELWRASNSQVERVADVTPGPDGTIIEAFYGTEHGLYFVVGGREKGGELWWSDGIPGGQTKRLVHEPGTDEHHGVQEVLGHLGNLLFLSLGHKQGMRAIWILDQQSHTSNILLVNGGRDLKTSSGVGGVWDGHLYFYGAANSGENERWHGLWRSDGTSAGTTFLAEFNSAGDFIQLGDKGLVFNGETSEMGMEPWITRGDSQSTICLKDIWEGPEHSKPSQFVIFDSQDEEAEPILFFAAEDPICGRELWESDGTKAGTMRTADLREGKRWGDPQFLTTNVKGLFFSAIGEGVGQEPYFLTAFGGARDIRLLDDLVEGPDSSTPYHAAVDSANGWIVVGAKSPKGEELWLVNPAGDEITLARDIWEGPGSAEPHLMTAISNGEFIFSAWHPVYGCELWFVRLDYAVELLRDINTNLIRNPSSSPTHLTPMGDLLFFVADDIEHGRELWVTRHGGAGAERVLDIYEGSNGSNPDQLTVVGESLYFAAESPDAGRELWQSDGTREGTGRVGNINPFGGSSGPKHLFVFGNLLLLSAYEPSDGEELWVVRPGQKPELLRDIRNGEDSSSPAGFVLWQGAVYFHADDGEHGRELWRTDGTTEGTVRVEDITPVPVAMRSVSTIEAVDDYLYVAGNRGGYGEELYVISDESHRPRLVHDVARPLGVFVRGRE